MKGPKDRRPERDERGEGEEGRPERQDGSRVGIGRRKPDESRGEAVVGCVPNFSEGRDLKVIEAIVDAIASSGVAVLGVDPGAGANRTVVTFAGPPDRVQEGAYRGIVAATERIDMSRHRGVHARMGATDVCPFVPVRGVGMDDCVGLAEAVGERVGRELSIPVYLYARAARRPERVRLPEVRRGQYEALARQLRDPAWKPDFGPAVHNVRAGATAVGARPFLIAWNVNLDTHDTRAARAIARRLRETGEAMRDEDGRLVLGPDGRPERRPGRFRSLQGDGWYIPEYARAQVTFNILDHEEAPLHEVFEACRREAAALGTTATGSELVGLVPLDAMLASGAHYLGGAGPEERLVTAAIEGLGLEELRWFRREDRVFEYVYERRASLLRPRRTGDGGR